MRIDTGGASHIVVRRPRRHGPLRPPVPDVRHDLAGLQPVRRQQPLRRLARRDRAPTRSATTARSHPRLRRRPGLAVQRRVPDDPVARGQRLQRQLLDRRRHRSARRRAARAQGLPVGRPRRVLVGRAAHERRGRARRRREPRVLQRQRGLLEDALGEQHRRLRNARTGRSSATRKRTPTRRSIRARDVDRHLARPAIQPARRRRPAGERADRHDLHGQRRHVDSHPGSGGVRQLRFWRNTSVATLATGRHRDAHQPARSATSGTRTSTTARDRPA